MKLFLTILACNFYLAFSFAQQQVHTEFTNGGDIIFEENNDSLPEIQFDNADRNIASIGLETTANTLAPDDDDLIIKNTANFGKINLLVNSGGMTINPNMIGNGAYIGINTGSPTTPLTANIINGGAAADFLSTNGDKAYLQFSVNDGVSVKTQGYLGVTGINQPQNLSLGTIAGNTIGHLHFTTQNINRMTVQNTGEVFIGDYSNFSASTTSNPAALNICGNTQASGSFIANSFVCNSDMRFKANITTLTNALAGVLQLNGVYYDWNTNAFPQHGFSENKQIGLLAQEVEAIFPELVQASEQGYKTVDYVSLTAILVEAIKEQNKKIISLEKKAQSDDLEQRVKELEQLLKQ